MLRERAPRQPCVALQLQAAPWLQARLAVALLFSNRIWVFSPAEREEREDMWKAEGEMTEDVDETE